LRNELQLKFFLAGDLPIEHGLSLLADYKTQQEDIAQTYAESERILSTALDHGVLSVNARISWCKESIAELKKEQKKRRKKSD